MRFPRFPSSGPEAGAPTAARRRPRLITALAAATAAAAVALAVAAWLVPRHRERRARAALTDYAGYFVATVLDNAGLEIGRTLHDRLFVPSRMRVLATVDSATSPGAGPRGGGAPRPVDDVMPSLAAWVTASDRADDRGWVPVVAEPLRFRYDERRGTLETAGADTMPRLRRWLADTLRVLPRHYGAAPAFLAGRPLLRALLYPGSRGPGLGVAVRAVYRPDGSRVLYGYVGDLRPMLAVAIPDVVARTPLFPRSLRRAVPNRALVSVSIADAAGTVLFADGVRAAGSSTGASGTALPSTALVFDDPAFGGVRVTLTPRTGVPEVIAGRLPVPWLAATDGAGDGVLAGLTALLVTLLACTLASAWVTRREAALAATRVDFLAAVSHEFRTPLAQILIAADTLPLVAREAFARADRTALDATAALDAIVHGAERLGHLVDNVLHVARGDRPDAAPRREPLQLAPLVEDVVERFLPVASEADVEVAVALAPHVVVEASRELVTRIVLNLLDNAVKYGPRPQTVVVSLARCPSGRARLTVDDEGPGIPPPDRARVWDAFVRLARDAARPGSGIGLTVVRDLARRLGGTARVTDAPGGGARFVVELPLVEGTQAAAAPR